jgi:hypothetical protein
MTDATDLAALLFIAYAQSNSIGPKDVAPYGAMVRGSRMNAENQRIKLNADLAEYSDLRTEGSSDS